MLRLYPLLLEPCGKLKDKDTLSAILGMAQRFGIGLGPCKGLITGLIKLHACEREQIVMNFKLGKGRKEWYWNLMRAAVSKRGHLRGVLRVAHHSYLSSEEGEESLTPVSSCPLTRRGQCPWSQSRAGKDGERSWEALWEKNGGYFFTSHCG